MPKWTDSDIPDLSGKKAIVTGANSGLGLRTALELTRHGAGVGLACRSAEHDEEALGTIRAEVPDGDVTLASLDLADLTSVRAFAAAHTGPLDLLVNNAGVMALPHRTTADGFEMQFGTNHLGHLALTGLLLPGLLARPGARVVTVTSLMHRFGRLGFDDLDAERHYRKWPVNCRSKLANLVFAKELDRRAPFLSVAPTRATPRPTSSGPARAWPATRWARCSPAWRPRWPLSPPPPVPGRRCTRRPRPTSRAVSATARGDLVRAAAPPAACRPPAAPPHRRWAAACGRCRRSAPECPTTRSGPPPAGHGPAVGSQSSVAGMLPSRVSSQRLTSTPLPPL